MVSLVRRRVPTVVGPAVAGLALIGIAVGVAPMATAAPADASRLVTPSDIPAALGSPRAGSGTYVTEEPAIYGLQVCNDSGSTWDVQVPGPSTFTVASIGLGEDMRSGVGQFVYRFGSTKEARQTFTALTKKAPACRRTATSPYAGGTVTTKLTTQPGPRNPVEARRTTSVWVNHANRYAGVDTYGESIDRYADFRLAGDAIIVTAAWRMTPPGTDAAWSDAQRRAVDDLSKTLATRWVQSAG